MNIKLIERSDISMYGNRKNQSGSTKKSNVPLGRIEDSRLSKERLTLISAAIDKDVKAGLYDGAAIIVARHGIIGLHEAIGFSGRSKNRSCRKDDIFKILSVSKAFIDVLILSGIEHGDLALTTKVTDIIPEFKGGLKEKITIFNLMTYTGGPPNFLFPVELNLMGNLSAVIKAICQLDLIAIPGEVVGYSPVWGHALLGEILRRIDSRKRALRDILYEDLFNPLKMTDTALGLPRRLKSRAVPIVIAHPEQSIAGGAMSPQQLEEHNLMITEDAEIPWMGCVSTAQDVFRFTEMLRRGGELDGARILSPATIKLATTIQTGSLVNQHDAMITKERGFNPGPANYGLGFVMRGQGIIPDKMGNFSSPSTYGRFGAGSMAFWVDPERDLTFVFLSAGELGDYENTLRLQRLSDMVTAAAL
jgi:CubicO group peptidase (beta-lactamase class C family)